MNKINLYVGDHHNEGHEQREGRVIYSNFSKKEIEKTFRIGAKKLQCDITKYCTDLEDNEIPVQIIDKFVALGLEFEIDQNSKQKKYEIDIQTFIDCYLLTVKAGNEKFNWEFEETCDSLYVGGYGLFSY
jgi:hypothetical protein